MMRRRGGGRCGAGRPRTLDGRRAVCVTLDRAALARLTAWADSLGVSRSAALRYLLEQAPQPKPRSTDK